MPQKVKYLKRYNENGRQLCVGNDNTCPNLAGYKQTVRGIRKYHNECDTHRRHYHFTYNKKNKNFTHYLPLKDCENCGNKAEHRHRIDRATGYRINNIMQLCLPCHQKIHSI